MAPATRIQTPPRRKSGGGTGGHLSQCSNGHDGNGADDKDGEAEDDSRTPWEWCSGNTKNTKDGELVLGHSKCGLGMVFWEHEEHEVAYSWVRAFRMWPGNGVLGTRTTGNGLQLAPGITNVSREWRSGNTKKTKWPTVGSGHSKCGPGRHGYEWMYLRTRLCYQWM